jgi:ribosomal protein L11 methyltransferase
MGDKYWLEVSLTVDGEMAEAVADVLRRYIPDGVAIASTAVTAGPADENGHAIGPLQVCGYIPGDEALESTRQQIEEGLWYLGRISPLPAAEFKVIHEENWMESWKVHYHPIPIGRKLLILPAWIDAPEAGRIPIRIDVGMAFGTGTHPTTQLCLELLEDCFASLGGEDTIKVIDIGCGTGILSIAALKLGARRALGVDIDLEAIRAAGENSELNGVKPQMELGIGSLKDVIDGEFGYRQAHIVLANILAPVLVDLLNQELGELVLPQGCLILSGILVDQSTQVEAALGEHGFNQLEKRQLGDWVAIAAQR